jgi:hypothetical protein
MIVAKLQTRWLKFALLGLLTLAMSASSVRATDPPVPPSPCIRTTMLPWETSTSIQQGWWPAPPGGDYGTMEWLPNWVFGLNFSPWHAPNAPGAAAIPCQDQPAACWRMDPASPQVVIDATRPAFGDSRGFPLNLDIYNVPATTNFPPLSQNAWASTAPMVSTPGDQTYRPLFLADRKLVAGVVDPITGQPLIREVDLELPLGNATYRMIRSYGGCADGLEGHYEQAGGATTRRVQGKYWDWAGTGWMLSENPVLLFDAQYIQHEPSLPRRCYLILDAHHSIPFTQDPQHGTYAAPAWFDAIMSWEKHPSDGNDVPVPQWSSSTKSWTVAPKRIRVKLYGESVTYTFDIQQDNLASLSSTGGTLDAHASPRITNAASGLEVHAPSTEGGGLGIPRVALLKKIEDRFGNKAVMDYCDVRRSAVSPPVWDCTSCVHTCAEKG